MRVMLQCSSNTSSKQSKCNATMHCSTGSLTIIHYSGIMWNMQWEHIRGMTASTQQQQSKQHAHLATVMTTNRHISKHNNSQLVVFRIHKSSKHSNMQQSSKQEHRHKHNSRQRMNSKHCGMQDCSKCNTRHSMHTPQQSMQRKSVLSHAQQQQACRWQSACMAAERRQRMSACMAAPGRQ